MRKHVVAAVAALLLGAISPAMAAGPDVNCPQGGCVVNSPFSGNTENNTYNQGGTGVGVGVGVGVGIGKGGDGGNAYATGGNSYSGGNKLENNVGNGIGNFSPSASARIERGAVEVDNKNTNFNTNINDNRSSSNQKQGQGQLQGQGQHQSQGNKQIVNFEDSGRADANINYSGSYTVKSAPNIAIGGPASGPCNGFSGGIGGSWLGGALGLNVSTVDEGCEDRETARMFHQLGDTKTGLEILKHSKAYQRMEANKAEAAKKKAEADAEQAARLAEAARINAIKAKNPTSDGSWQGKDYSSDAGSVQPTVTRIWTGNSQGESNAFTVTVAEPSCYTDEVIAYRMGKPVCQ